MLTKAKLKARESGGVVRNNPVKMFWIENLRQKIALPYSLQTRQNQEIDLFGIPLRVVKDCYGAKPGVLATMGKLIPDSWLIDLNQDVPADELETAET